MKKSAALVLFYFSIIAGFCQGVNPGSTCDSATNLCSLDAFTVGTLPIGGTSFTSWCFGSTPDDGQWYKFTVSVTGQLAWRCTPDSQNIELDWALYNITNGCPT